MEKNFQVGFIRQLVILRALANPTRLMLLNKLKGKEMSVFDLNMYSNLDQSTISRHLIILKKAGILKSYKRKKEVIHFISCPDLLFNLLHCLEKL